MRILIDEAGDIPPELAKQYNIATLPINIMFGTTEYLSGVNIDHASFYEMTQKVDDSNFPKTSQPTPYQFAERYRQIIAEGDSEILTIVVSEKLSGTYASAIQAAKELEGQGTFHVFNSKAGSAVQGYMAIEAAKMIEAGVGIEGIMAKLEKMRDETVVILTIDSLEYAVRGGRVSSLKSVMASLLNLKPILRLEDGVFAEAGRVRTRQKALSRIVEMVHQQIGDRPARIAILHANAQEHAQKLRQMSEALFNQTELFISDLSIAVAVNLGPGALGLVAIPE